MIVQRWGIYVHIHNPANLTINVWERIGEKHLAQLMGEGTCQPDIFTKYRLGCELIKLWDMSHLFVCFVALVIQGGAMAKFWPLHHYNQCMGENRRKILSTNLHIYLVGARVMYVYLDKQNSIPCSLLKVTVKLLMHQVLAHACM